MLNSFFQNISVGMSKDAYFEMCESLGSEPIHEEIPVEYEDFPDTVKEAIDVYYKLKDEWDGMNGIYLGKSYSGFTDILDILEIPFEDRKLLLEWITVMDDARKKVLTDIKKSKESKADN
jgi:hypothetical protein